MSRKAAKKAKPKPRGLQGGRKPKYIRPGEGVEMTKMTFRIRSDIAEMIVDAAAAQNMSKDEWLMRKVSPQWMATLDAWHVSQRRARGSDAAKRALAIAEEFRASVADCWETGSLSTCRGGWSVTMRHVTTREAREVIFPNYPAKQFWTAAELDGFTPALVKGGAQ